MKINVDSKRAMCDIAISETKTLSETEEQNKMKIETTLGILDALREIEKMLVECRWTALHTTAAARRMVAESVSNNIRGIESNLKELEHNISE
jgi:hypothetical protein